MKTATACTAVLLLMTVPAMAQGNGSSVTLDQVEGLVDGNIMVGSGVVIFHFGFTNGDGANKAKSVTNGFEFSGSDSSVTWELDFWTEFAWGPDPGNIIFFAPPHYWHGVGSDTIGFRLSVVMLGPGLPPGYSGPALAFSAELTDTASAGGTFCIDSAWFPPDGSWIWAYGSTVGSFPPSWQGPHCWPIIGQCCLGLRGNVDGSADDLLDIADLVYLADYQFGGGPAPPCMEEADIDGSGAEVIDITDLVWMMEFMFDGGLSPAACP
ncbi:MAG: hypothetical protein OEV49_11275 [candidate division Zixibacteria bacterium]|nr:hypothetical protein [candidate division Zixibacteria bacterium]MDH3937512.1 hypothetical protein [candidate division Zixibacteria bacterium]MDH4034128.1 hypothetical protein [candidate division Zixibacteria bacterium]